jgi:hypothetical protein
LAASFISSLGIVTGRVRPRGALKPCQSQCPLQPPRRRIGDPSRGLRSANQNNIVRSKDKSPNALTNDLRPGTMISSKNG